jgi:hypothetical protein
MAKIKKELIIKPGGVYSKGDKLLFLVKDFDNAYWLDTLRGRAITKNYYLSISKVREALKGYTYEGQAIDWIKLKKKKSKKIIKQKFKIGDRVKVMKIVVDAPECTVGKSGKIISTVTDNENTPYGVRFPERINGWTTWNYSAKELKRIK